MKIFTIGFTKTRAEDFFTKIKNNRIELLLDIRLNNTSQLAGYTKSEDLAYFLREICNCEYIHDKLFAPTTQILENYRKDLITWNQYEEEFLILIKERKIKEYFELKYKNYDKICLLCSEKKADKCHRRLIANFLRNENDVVIHL